MKNLIRFFAFSFALLVAANLSAQTDLSYASVDNAPEISPSKNSEISTRVTKEYISMNNYAIIDMLKGSINYQVYIKKSPGASWELVEKENNKDATELNTESGSSEGDVVISQPGAYQLKVVVSMECKQCATVVFRY